MEQHENWTPERVEAAVEAFLLPTYARTRFHPVTGRGARLVDATGRERWDLLGGIAVNALGYRHPRIVKALREGAGSVLHVSNLFYMASQAGLAERLVRLSGLSRVFLCNSGTEANEAALKLARLKTPGRSRVVALEGSFHGRTFGALSMTGNAAYREPFEPLVPGVTFVPVNDRRALEEAVTEETSAIFLEPILGEGGIVPLEPEVLATARDAADRTGALLIFDEIQCGLGRTGHVFAFQASGVVPDVVTLAKPLGGGLPLGAVVTGPALEGVVKPGQHGTTFGGNPLACRLGEIVLDEISTGGLAARCAGIGVWFRGRLEALRRRAPAVREIRGAGLMWGIELDREAGPVQAALLERGFVVGTARKNVIRLLPPYVIPRAALSAFLVALEDSLKEPAA